MSASGGDKMIAPEQENSGNNNAEQNLAVSTQTATETDQGLPQKALTSEATVQKETASSDQSKKEPTNTVQQPVQKVIVNRKGAFVLFPERPATPPRIAYQDPCYFHPGPQPTPPDATPGAVPRRLPRHKTAAQWRRYHRLRNRRKRAPKRPMTAYMAFVQDYYQRQYHWQGKACIYGAELGKAWRALGMQQKAAYFRTAAADRERWVREKKEHAKKLGPRRPRSAYAWFVRKVYLTLPKVPNADVRHYGKELGRRWRALPLAERFRFQKIASKDVTRFAREKASWLRLGKDGWR